MNRNIWIDYLRSAITVLVVAHHSSLAYTTFAWFDKEAYINSTHPIVDAQRWIGLDIFENFNDVFFMSLMFLIGGLFLSKSIQKKGSIGFIRDRFYRLLVPALFLGTLLMLIAYFPSWYVAHQNTHIIAYVKDFFMVEKWPAGPPWFIYVLFVFNLVFALFHSFFKKMSELSGNQMKLLKNKPFVLFLILFGFSWLLYVPLAYFAGAGTWIGIGPFDFQLSRILLYFGYFTLGILIGKTDFNQNLFSTESKIVKNWHVWIFLSLSVYALLTIIVAPLTKLVKEGSIKELYGWMIYFPIFVSSCTLSCIAFISVFRKWIHKEKPWWRSLSDNAYLIYLIHYVFVIWCQFLLMPFNIPAFIKFSITLIVALSLSWIASHLLRKIKVINSYL